MTAYQYVLDPTAKRLIDNGVNPETIEDAYVLAENVERRVEFQAWVQKYVDHGISSTINLPAWGSEHNNSAGVHEFGDPDGARGGQPLTPIKYATASKHVGEVFIEQADVCDISGKGTCGS
jgi:ribonucleoside-diphosphate reductase alpha chain